MLEHPGEQEQRADDVHASSQLLVEITAKKILDLLQLHLVLDVDLAQSLFGVKEEVNGLGKNIVLEEF